MAEFTLSKNCKYLPYLIIITLIVNLSTVYSENIGAMRIARLFSTALFFGYYWIRSSRRRLIIVSILAAFFLRDVAILFYDIAVGHAFYLIFGLISYALICIERIEILEVIKSDKTALILTLVFMVLSTFALHEITSLIDGNHDRPFDSFLVYVYGIIMILLGVVAVMYNQIYNSNKSLAFVIFAICFLISDVTALFAYYLNYQFLFYIDKTFQVLGFGFYLFTVLQLRGEEEEKEQFELLS